MNVLITFKVSFFTLFGTCSAWLLILRAERQTGDRVQSPVANNFISHPLSYSDFQTSMIWHSSWNNWYGGKIRLGSWFGHSSPLLFGSVVLQPVQELSGQREVWGRAKLPPDMWLGKWGWGVEGESRGESQSLDIPFVVTPQSTPFHHKAPPSKGPAL